MNQPLPPDHLPEFTNSDGQWFDHLAGRMHEASSAEALQQADALRRTLQRQGAEADSDPALAQALSAEAEDRSWEVLQLRREKAKRQQTLRKRWWSAGAALAAAVMLSVVLLQSPTDPIIYDEPPTLRGSLDPTLVPTSQPRAAAESLAGAMKESGFAATLHQRGHEFSVDVFVTADGLLRAREALQRAGIGSVNVGLNRVTFVPAARGETLTGGGFWAYIA